MLEMSNGYPHSSSPLGGSPSPGPSPGGIGAHHLSAKCKHDKLTITKICRFLFCRITI